MSYHHRFIIFSHFCGLFFAYFDQRFSAGPMPAKARIIFTLGFLKSKKPLACARGFESGILFGDDLVDDPVFFRVFG